jgi:hypothetical protein
MPEYSQAAYRFGDYVAKFGVFPLGEEQKKLEKDYIKDDDPINILSQHARNFHLNHKVTYSFCAQLLQNLDEQPVDDIGVEWDSKKYPFEQVAHLEFEPQDSWLPEFRVWWDDRKFQGERRRSDEREEVANPYSFRHYMQLLAWSQNSSAPWKHKPHAQGRIRGEPEAQTSSEWFQRLCRASFRCGGSSADPCSTTAIQPQSWTIRHKLCPGWRMMWWYCRRYVYSASDLHDPCCADLLLHSPSRPVKTGLLMSDSDEITRTDAWEIVMAKLSYRPLLDTGSVGSVLVERIPHASSLEVVDWIWKIELRMHLESPRCIVVCRE